MIVYKIVNKVNDKIYIGQTIHSLDWRKKRHLRALNEGTNTHLYQAMRKYGVDNFEFSVICEVFDKKTLNELETYYINKFDTIKNGYNMVDGGNNNVMFVESVKQKHKHKMQSEETRNKISESMVRYRKEHPFTEEHRKKLSKKAMGNHNFGNTDTRSIGCFCIVSNGDRHDFHSYRDAYRWWCNCVDNPFNTKAECVFQRKIKQSIDLGYFTYGKTGIKYYYPKWYKKEGGNIEKVN